MPKNDSAFKVQFHKKNLALKMPNWAAKMLKWAIKMPKLATCCKIFVAKKTGVFITKIYFSVFYTKKTALKLL